MATGVELATAWVRLVPSMDGAQGEVTKALGPAEAEAEKSGKRAGGKFSTGLKVAALAGGAAIGAGIAKVFSVGLEEIKFGEQINAQTDTLVKNTGFKMATDQINDYTLALSKVSGISEEDLQQAGNNVLKFGDVNEETYKKAVDALNNMGSAGKDVAGTSEALGKALADPANAAALLKRQGVLLNDEQKALIDNLTATGDKAGAQAVILDALEGTYGGMAEKTGGTLTGNLNKLQNQFENLSGDLVTAVMPAITGLVSGLQGFIDWLSENQQVIPIFATAIGVLLVGAFIAWTASIWASTVALLANPVTWVIIGILALIAAIVLLAMNWDTVAKWIGDVWGGFISWLTSVMDGFVAWWNGMWAGFFSWTQSLIAGFSSWWSGVWNGIVNFFKLIWAAVVFAVTLYINIVRTIITTVVNAIATVWRNIWNGIVSFFTGVWNGILNTISTVQGAFSRVFSTIKGIITGAFEGAVSVVRGVINNIIGLVNGAIRGINNVVGAVGSAIGITIKVPEIPKLADGATILPRHGGTLAILAEAGRSETVVDTGKLNAVLDGIIAEDRDEKIMVVNKAGNVLEELVEIYVEKNGQRRRVSLENGLRTI